MAPEAEIQQDDGDRVVVAALDGEIDLTRAPDIRHELMEIVTNQQHGIVLDLSEATYIDSAGVNLLFELAERLSARQLRLAAVVAPNTLIDDIAELTHLGSAIGIHSTRDAAIVDAARPL
jgi:anti-anti-sigma factor